jgi:hypothetical protein
VKLRRIVEAFIIQLSNDWCRNPEKALFDPCEADSMSQSTATIRDKVHAIADELPADASWDDVIEEARSQGS